MYFLTSYTAFSILRNPQLHSNKAPTTPLKNTNIPDTVAVTAALPVYEDGVADAVPVPVALEPPADPVAVELDEFAAINVKFAHVNLVVLLA